ncbi:T9SS type A sorting domain-containing protein, partial [bacterium]|nr:T9SS type A sorting domain-containing protein [bacterium]
VFKIIQSGNDFLSKKDLYLKIFDLSGREIFSRSSNSGIILWQPNGISAGVYLYKAVCGGNVYNGRIIFIK